MRNDEEENKKYIYSFRSENKSERLFTKEKFRLFYSIAVNGYLLNLLNLASVPSISLVSSSFLTIVNFFESASQERLLVGR